MGKLEKIEQLRKLKDSGSLTEEEFQREKDKLLNNLPKGDNKKTIIVVIVIVLLIACIGLGGYYFMNNNSSNNTIETSATDNKKQDSENTSKFEEKSSNITVAGTKNVSFENINSDDENLTDIQKDIVNYFDNDYFEFYSTYAQKYPQIFQGAKVTTSASVVKVLKSTNEEFEVLAVDCGAEGQGFFYYDNAKIEDISEESLLVITGKQLNERLITGDKFFLYGRYKDVDNREIDGKSYMVSKIEANNIVRINNGTYISKHSYDTVKNVAEYIFGKDIKISEDNKSAEYYKVTLDNQSNANFKVFDMRKDYGGITYDVEANDLGSNIEKKLFVSADFENYIVSTYDQNTKHVYIEYFNRELKKVWSRQFDYASTKAFVSPMDYTDSQMAVVVDNDLYLIDLATGENIIEPVMVGEKVRVVMMADGIILIGDNNKDAIMKVDYSGKVEFRKNAGTTYMGKINSAEIQVINGKLHIFLSGMMLDEYGYDIGPMEKYIVVNSNGEIETASEDLDVAG